MKSLKEIISTFGKDKLNSFTKYPSILTFHELGDKGILKNNTTINFNSNEEVFLTEKIDGTNVRIICFGDEYIIGSRENLLYIKGDTFYGSDLDIVDILISNGTLDKIEKFKDKNTNCITTIYGELYGGKIGRNAKQYGNKKENNFIVFDVVKDDIENALNILSGSIEEISYWREHQKGSTLEYGQKFIAINEARYYIENILKLEFVPEISFKIEDTSHTTLLNGLQDIFPTSKVKISDEGLGMPEGVIVRNKNRSKIAKIRYEDLKRTIKKK